MAMVTLEQGDRTFLGSNNGGVTGRHPVRLDEADLRFLEKYEGEYDIYHAKSCAGDITAQLGACLLYTSFKQTLEAFLAEVALHPPESLQELNAQFNAWLSECYHSRPHHPQSVSSGNSHGLPWRTVLPFLPSSAQMSACS